MASDLAPEAAELAWMERLSRETGQAVTFALLQNDLDPAQWQRMLTASEEAASRGARIAPQVAARPTSILLGLSGRTHPFASHTGYREIAHLPLDERVRRMRDPELRRRILDENVQFTDPVAAFVASAYHKVFPLGDPPDYEPAREQSAAARAEREGRRLEEVLYDLLLERDGRALLYFPLLNYSNFDFGPIRDMLLHPHAVLGLGDGGAHCGLICDAGTPTFMLTHWVRDRRRGERIPLEFAVRRQTGDTARFYGFHDRGVLAPGMRADVNVIDFERLALTAPEMVYDLPAQGRRLIQGATGYRMTVKSGTPIFESGEATGALPGRLVRGTQAAR
jgi:N-acyl-D-aspartate/D-glutamate deacylase